MVPDVYILFLLKNKRCAIFLEETDVQIQQQIQQKDLSKSCLLCPLHR